MARYKIPYPGLSASLKHLRVQVIHSLPYAVRNLPALNTPEQIFNYCKSRYTFKSDPRGTELFQTVPTLLEDNEIGAPGTGDCDDATIFCLTMLLRSNFRNCGIVLAGRSNNLATHIYAYVDTDENGRQYLDLTTSKFNKEGGQGKYSHRQKIPFKISPNQLNMFLQLADGARTFRKRPRLRKLTDQQKEQGIYIPSKNVFIPVDRFDKLPIKKAKQTLLSEGYEVEQLSDYLSGRAERKRRKEFKQYKKEKKFETKTGKKEAKTEKKLSRAELTRAKASKKVDTGTARRIKAEGKKIKAERGEESGGKKFFKKSGDFFNRIISPDEESPEAEEVDAEEVDAEETDYQQPETDQQEEQEEELSAGFASLTTKDAINAGLFIAGLFLEKTKRVA